MTEHHVRDQAREINLQLSGIGAAPQLLWLTLSALRCPLPPLWQQTGPTLFVHLTTGEHRQNHPLTPVFRETARQRTLTLPLAPTPSHSPSPNQVRKLTLTLTLRILTLTLTVTLTVTLTRCASWRTSHSLRRSPRRRRWTRSAGCSSRTSTARPTSTTNQP